MVAEHANVQGLTLWRAWCAACMIRRMTRRLLRPLFRALTLTAVVLGPGSASAAVSHTPQRCRALHGDVELSTRTLKVVRRRDADGYDELRACVKPNGRVRVIGVQADEGLGSASVSAGPCAGTWVRVDSEGSNQYGGGSSVALVDVRTGVANTVFASHYQVGDPGSDDILNGLFFDGHGRAVMAASTPGGYDHLSGHALNPQVSITAFAPDGTALVVDRGPQAALSPETLTFSAGIATWQHDGSPRSVTFG